MPTAQPQGELVICVVAMPADTNANGDIFGGWLVAHMDMGGGAAARRRALSRVVTVAINGMHFIKPITVGETVCCYADLLKVGHTSMEFKLEAWTTPFSAQAVQTKVAEGLFTFVAIDEAGKPTPVLSV